MNRVAIAFNTCDRIELTKQSIEPLLQPDKFDLHWCDGSKTAEGIDLLKEYSLHKFTSHYGVRGGSGPAIVYALTMLLAHARGMERAYDYIGLVENDVLLQGGWYEDLMALFKIGEQSGLVVGAASARCYEDRILIQRDGHAIVHNNGAGMIMFTRKAAELVLQNYRTAWTAENRLLFSQLSGLDIGKWWAFRGNENFLVADWRFDMILAANGLASLALTPNRATMLDQDIGPLGLKYADGKCDLLRNPSAFELYRDNLANIRVGRMRPGIHHPFYREPNGATVIFPHQVQQLGGGYLGNWRVRDFQGFGPFCWKAGKPAIDRIEPYPQMYVPVVGPCDFIVSGGELGGNIRIEDEQSGYVVEPALPAEDGTNFLQLSVPGSATYRQVKLTALSSGVCFLGLKTKEPQPWIPGVRFTFDTLPPP
jgi:hypothetical protein